MKDRIAAAKKVLLKGLLIVMPFFGVFFSPSLFNKDEGMEMYGLLMIVVALAVCLVTAWALIDGKE